MQKHRIRLGSTDSVNSVNKDNKVAVDIKQTARPLIFTSLKEEVDQYEIFKNERDSCSQFRLITTITPYCTNILFNPMTEIVYKEGSEDCEVVNGDKTAQNCKDKCYGIKKPTRVDMIRNTEYSRETIGYEYHPGMDIFNNHILRNTSFKIVNKCNSESDSDREIFNTIRDVLRNFNGDVISFKNRINLNNDGIKEMKKHLYDYKDIMDITDSINNNLMEENGWLGFVNKSTIISKKTNNSKDTNGRIIWEDEDFNHVINNKESCEFIDMYPDRTLYSFNPKFNFYKNRPEYNWNICLTYPYENFYNHKLIKGINKDNSTINALLINNVTYTTGINGENILLFQTFTKHNLKTGEYIRLYYKVKDEYKVIDNIRVSNVGDLDNNNKDYYFYTTDLKLLTELGYSETQIYEYKNDDGTEFDKDKLTESLLDKNCIFRFSHLINGYESEYYIRIFHKLPNLLRKNDRITKEIANNVDELKKILNHPLYFDKEQYQLAFASTIYNDKKTQLTFTDGISVENLLDNRGRPVSEIFLTIIKNNKGNKEWYSDKFNPDEDDYEYSHCFSEVRCGFDLFFDKYVKNAECSDVKTISYSNDEGYSGNFGWDDYDGNVEDITIDDNTFIGDLVEFNITDCTEVILEDCNFRFNTYMREYGGSGLYEYVYDEITADDYDKSNDENKSAFNVSEQKNDRTNSKSLEHPEGYYYKPHYRIQIKEFGNLHQAAHFDIKVKSLELDTIDDEVILKIQTTLPHKLRMNDVVLVCDEERNRILRTNVVYVGGSNIFAISKIGELSCKNIYDILCGKYNKIKFQLRRYNEEIPEYAEKYPKINRYMWRDVNTIGNKNNVTLPEYPFANGYFYIYQDINFYLKRQDPFGKIGLYYEGNKSIVSNDVYGNSLPVSEYEYKDESEAKC